MEARVLQELIRLEEKAAAEKKAEKEAAEAAARAEAEAALTPQQRMDMLANLGKGFQSSWQNEQESKKKEKAEKHKLKAEAKQNKAEASESNRQPDVEKQKIKQADDASKKSKHRRSDDEMHTSANKKARRHDTKTRDRVLGKSLPAVAVSSGSGSKMSDARERKGEASKKTESEASKKKDSAAASSGSVTRFSVDQDLKYLSAKFNAWVPCKVVKVDKQKDAVEINLKPGVWLKGSELESKLRILSEAEVGAGRCGLCLVVEWRGGGLLCKRIKEDGSISGCGAGVCWACMKKAPADIGKVRPHEKVFEALRTAGKNPWWMHEKCMAASDATDYAVQMMPVPI